MGIIFSATASTSRCGNISASQLCLRTQVFVGAGSEHNLSERELEGVVGGHAYSILHVVDVGADAERVRLLLLRNPWGKVNFGVEIKQLDGVEVD